MNTRARVLIIHITPAVVMVLRCFKCSRLPEEARKKKELALKRQESEENATNLGLNSTDGHVASHVRSPYEGNVDRPLDPPGNVDAPLVSPPAPKSPVNVVHNPSAGHKPPAARYSRYSHEPSDSVELRYIRSRTTSEVRDSMRDSYYHENTNAVAEGSPIHHSQSNSNGHTQFPTVMSTSTRI